MFKNLENGTQSAARKSISGDSKIRVDVSLIFHIFNSKKNFY
jgi:hypothetical protein